VILLLDLSIFSSAFSLPSQRQQRRRSLLSTTTRLRGCSVELTDPETGCQVVLLGCFHGSKSSAADVESALKTPTDVVVLELCASRFADLRNELALEDAAAAAPNQDAKVKQPWILRYFKMVEMTAQSQGLPTAIAAAVLGAVSGMQTAISNLEPGLEFTTATRIAARENIDIVLADQSVDTTLRKMGSLPQFSLDMWKEFLFSASRPFNWKGTFGREASALKTALLGNHEGNHRSVTLPAFLTRSDAARKDLLRLTVAPLLLLQLFNVAFSQGLGYLLLSVDPALAASSSSETTSALMMDSFFTTSASASTNPDLFSSLAILLANAVFVTAGYVSIALPATRVVLRERDDQLTKGIRAACRQIAGSDDQKKNVMQSPKRVVAVLGLLHVNGVAQRLLEGGGDLLERQTTAGA